MGIQTANFGEKLTMQGVFSSKKLLHVTKSS